MIRVTTERKEGAKVIMMMEEALTMETTKVIMIMEEVTLEVIWILVEVIWTLVEWISNAIKLWQSSYLLNHMYISAIECKCNLTERKIYFIFAMSTLFENSCYNQKAKPKYLITNYINAWYVEI